MNSKYHLQNKKKKKISFAVGKGILWLYTIGFHIGDFYTINKYKQAFSRRWDYVSTATLTYVILFSSLARYCIWT